MKFLLLIFLSMTPPIDSEEAKNEISLIHQDDVIEIIKRDDYFHPILNDVFVDKNKLHSLVDQLEDQLYEKPQGATINEKGEIIEEKLGESVDREKLTHLVTKTLYQHGLQKINIPMQKVYPRVTSELLAQISSNKIGEYKTYFNEKNKERSHNIELATKAIHNVVIFPQERFSFNEIVGERTKEKGYMRAPVIVEGEFSEDIGGGICQVSSTLFNAVNLREVQIVERHSHSQEVPYVPPGKDASVSWWGPDFVFKNNYKEPILIQAFTKEGTMHIQIFTADDIS